MAKRTTISYRNTAILSLTGGIIALTASIVEPVLGRSDYELGILGTIMATTAILAWFLGAAAGVLALSTEYKRMAVTGLVLCGLAILIFVAAPTILGA